MFSSSALLSLLLLALSTVKATPIIRDGSSTQLLALASKINPIGAANLAQIDRTRTSRLLANVNASTRGKRALADPISAMNAVVSYTASVGVGNPAAQYELLIDTGSSNTWIGAGEAKYSPSKSSTKTNETMSVTYGTGSVQGDEYLDTVTLGKGLVIQQQSIGVATNSSGVNKVNGILGLGFSASSLSSGKTVLTVMDNLYKSRAISQEVLGVFFQPTSESNDMSKSGELLFGGVDSSKTSSPVTYVSVTKTSPASEFWGIDQSINYGTSGILSSKAGIVDTGTTLILFATDAYKSYVNATGGVFDETSGLLEITKEQYSALKPLRFEIGSNTYVFCANAQIWPRALNSQIGGKTESIYLIVADLGDNTQDGFQFVLGMVFLQRFYSVYDTGKKQVGLATTVFTDAISN